jgi:hypothetical protein
MAEQGKPISFRPYPPIKEIMESIEKPYKQGRKHWNRNHFINQCIAMATDHPIELLEQYKRGK